MRKKRYVVELSAEERKWLEKLIRKGKGPAKKQLKALLWADESPLGPRWGDPQISEALGTYPMICGRVRQKFAQSGMDTRQSTAVGSIWRNPNSPFSRRNVSTAASPTSKSSCTNSPHGRLTAMPSMPKLTGNSRPHQTQASIPDFLDDSGYPGVRTFSSSRTASVRTPTISSNFRCRPRI